MFPKYIKQLLFISLIVSASQGLANCSTSKARTDRGLASDSARFTCSPDIDKFDKEHPQAKHDKDPEAMDFFNYKYVMEIRDGNKSYLTAEHHSGRIKTEFVGYGIYDRAKNPDRAEFDTGDAKVHVSIFRPNGALMMSDLVVPVPLKCQ
jgi:hypothetical protein